MKYITIKGITPRGQRIINQSGDRWIIIQQTTEVSFSNKPGPWVQLRSVRGNSDTNLWIQLENDANYIVVNSD